MFNSGLLIVCGVLAPSAFILKFFFIIDTVYKVSVATTQTSPYRVGQALNLTCSITPQPSVQFYYQWKTSNENNNYFYFGTNRQYFAVEQLGIKQYQTVFYYCDVIINDYIVSGSIEITMEGMKIL